MFLLFSDDVWGFSFHEKYLNRLQPHAYYMPILFFLSNFITWDLFSRTHLFGNEFTTQDFALPPVFFFRFSGVTSLLGSPEDQYVLENAC